MIELQNINKRFGDNVIFENLSLRIENGKKYIIIGDNGVGKSLLLKIMVGYSKVQSGKVIIDGEVLGEKFDFMPDCGVSIDAPQFIDNLSGLDNLLEIANILKIADKNHIIELAKVLNLYNDLHKKYKTYSLGMRQKMRIIQAMMESPRILILDEPFDALDDMSKTTVKNLIDQYLLIDEYRIVIFTSHDSQMRDFADSVLLINNKKII